MNWALLNFHNKKNIYLSLRLILIDKIILSTIRIHSFPIIEKEI